MSVQHTNPCPKCGRTEIHTVCSDLPPKPSQILVDADEPIIKKAYADARDMLHNPPKQENALPSPTTPEEERLRAEWNVMARACGNWREWPSFVKSKEPPKDYTDDDWLASARAILERDRLRNVLENVLIETNFISLDAARSYIREVLEESITK
jgi:hypothetical protein